MDSSRAALWTVRDPNDRAAAVTSAAHASRSLPPAAAAEAVDVAAPLRLAMVTPPAAPADEEAPAERPTTEADTEPPRCGTSALTDRWVVLIPLFPLAFPLL